VESYITNTSLVTTTIMNSSINNISVESVPLSSFMSDNVKIENQTIRTVETLITSSLSDQLLVYQGQSIDARFIDYWFNDILSRR
jgi:hypothetical protein